MLQVVFSISVCSHFIGQEKYSCYSRLSYIYRPICTGRNMYFFQILFEFCWWLRIGIEQSIAHFRLDIFWSGTKHSHEELKINLVYNEMSIVTILCIFCWFSRFHTQLINNAKESMKKETTLFCLSWHRLKVFLFQGEDQDHTIVFKHEMAQLIYWLPLFFLQVQ